MLALLRPAGAGQVCGRGGRTGGVVGKGALQFLGLQLCVYPQSLQSLCGEVSLQYSCLLVAVVQPKGYVPVGSGPGGTQVHQAQLVCVRGIALIFWVHLLSKTMR